MSLIEKSSDARAAAVAAMSSTAGEMPNVESTPAPAEPETPSQPEPQPEPDAAASGRERGPDGKFKKGDARREARKLMGAKEGGETIDAEAPATTEEEPKPEKPLSRREEREQFIKARNQIAAAERIAKRAAADKAEAERLKAEAEAERKRYVDAKKSPVQYLKELSRETGIPFPELYEAATLEMTGLKKAPEPEDPPAIKALRAELETFKKAAAARDEAAQVERSQNIFVQTVKSGADKYPLLSDESEADQRQAAVTYAQRFHREQGRWPSYDETAQGLETGLRNYWLAKKEEAQVLQAKLAKFTPATPGVPDRRNGAGTPAHVEPERQKPPVSPRTLSNGHAAQTVSAAREMSKAERRAAARRLLGN